MLRILHDLLAPATCIGCAAPGPAWCAHCAGVAPRPIRRDVGITVHARYAFEGPVRRVIVQWKDEARAEATAIVVQWFREALAPLMAVHPDALLVPVPSSPDALRRRGGAVLVDALRSAAPGFTLEGALLSTARRRDQAGLNRRDRAVNLAHSMRWIGGIDRPIILVDDLITTGATLRESARAVWSGGGRPVGACTIAFRERADPFVGPHEGLRLT